MPASAPILADAQLLSPALSQTAEQPLSTAQAPGWRAASVPGPQLARSLCPRPGPWLARSLCPLPRPRLSRSPCPRPHPRLLRSFCLRPRLWLALCLCPQMAGSTLAILQKLHQVPQPQHWHQLQARGLDTSFNHEPAASTLASITSPRPRNWLLLRGLAASPNRHPPGLAASSD